MINENFGIFKQQPDPKSIQRIPLSSIDSFVKRVSSVEEATQEKPSKEREEEIRKGLERIAEVFASSGIYYVLDGALNISLYGGDFFRDHRDVDFGVFSTDIPKLVETFENNGFALFRFPEDVNSQIEKDGVLVHELIRPKDVDVSHVSREHIFFLKVKDNSSFEIDTDNYECFDIHALDRDGNGDILMPNGVVISKHFYEDVPKYETKSGRELNLCHPVVLAYHKLIQGRKHDLADVKYMLEKGFLDSEDIHQVDSLLAQNEQNSWEEEIRERAREGRKLLSLRASV